MARKPIPDLKGVYVWILGKQDRLLNKGAKERKITKSAYLREILVGSLTE